MCNLHISHLTLRKVTFRKCPVTKWIMHFKLRDLRALVIWQRLTWLNLYFPMPPSGMCVSSRTPRSSLTGCVRTWSWPRWRMPRHPETRCTRPKRPRRPSSWAAKPSDTWPWTMYYRWNTQTPGYSFFYQCCPVGGADIQQLLSSDSHKNLNTPQYRKG